jgi:hypothetical protein
MTTYEYRVCRSLESDDTTNTLELYPGPTFGIMEFLDHKDSRYFAKFVTKKGWREITPDEHKKAQTFYNKKPADAVLKAFEDITPDWFYISGHYARTSGKSGVADAVNYPLPAGFFNEPFHDKEWLSEWNRTSNQSLFVQTEKMSSENEKEFRAVMEKVWLRSPYADTTAHKSESANETDKASVIDAWVEVWKNSQSDVTLGGKSRPGLRGVLTGTVWDNVKVVMLVGCNTLAWPKELFREAFPNALVLGYTNKNPANGTPHIKAFLRNLFKGISSSRDPRLSDHDHIAKSWMDVYLKQRLNKSVRMCYMKTDGKVMAFDKHGKVFEAGSPGEVMVRYDNGNFIKTKDFFAMKDYVAIRSGD